MRDGCPVCGSPPGPRIEHPMDDGNELHHCKNGHFFANPVFDFAHIEKGVPVSFSMSRAQWEALPLYTGEPQDGAVLFRDPVLIGVVHRWMGKHWWQARLSFAPSPPARMPY